jgi:hypothetical protein
MMNNFSFYHNDFFPTTLISPYSITILLAFQNLFQFLSVQNLPFGKGLKCLLV